MAQSIQALGIKHEAILNFVLQNPTMTQEQIAQHFGLTRVWMNCVMNSDAFRAALKERQAEIAGLVDMTVADRIRGTADFALQKLGTALEVSLDPRFILDATDKLLHRAGYAPSKGPSVAVQVTNNTQNNVIAVEKDVLAECRQAMLSQAQQPAISAPDEKEVFDAVFTELKVQTA